MRTRLLFCAFLGAALLVQPSTGLTQPPGKGRKGESPFIPKGNKASSAKAGDLKKYDDVITKDFTTQTGVFAVHRHDDKVYFEIPQDTFGRLFLWRAEVAKGPGGSSWGGAEIGHAVLKFERRGNKIYLWKVGFAKRASGKAIQSAVEAAATDSIIATYSIECEGKDRSAVVNMSDVVVNSFPDLPLSRAAGGGGASIDMSRSYLTDLKAFPTNIEARALVTFRGGGGGSSIPGLPPGVGGGSRSVTSLVHQSLAVLPETPMQGRLFDSRVGYFTEEFTDYSSAKQWAENKEYISRFRLEKKDPKADVSEPVKPIVIYLSKEIPEKWRPFLKQGVEDWKPAFEKAGFKNAIICKDAPSRAEDPNFDPEDARYSVIRWVAEPIANAQGPHVHDPRSGEIISAHIIFWHDIVKLTQMWYFVQCSAQDSKARHFPLADDLTGELMRYVCCHEVGHTLGLRHNHRASQAYSISQLRDPEFCKKYGSVASIMSYGRYNYVCQPEDGVKCMIPKLAPYDYFAIEWGYKPIDNAKRAEDEKKTLDEWASKQIDNPFLRFGGEDAASMVDPTVLTENIGSDPVGATRCGLKNLDRVMDHLVAATTAKGEDYSLLEEVYGEVLGHRSRWFSAVAKQVGGVVEHRTLGGRGGETFVRISKDKQKESVKFLLENAFTTPTKLLNPAIVNQFKFSGATTSITSQQRALLSSLLSASRLSRLFDGEVLSGDKAYTPVELVDDLQTGIFSELKEAEPKIDPIRRQLQRSYIDILKNEFQPANADLGGPILPGRRGGRTFGDVQPRTSELRGVARVALAKLEKQIATAKGKAKDVATIAHLGDLESEIKVILSEEKK